jgi:hypothetical protein
VEYGEIVLYINIVNLIEVFYDFIKDHGEKKARDGLYKRLYTLQEESRGWSVAQNATWSLRE